MKVNKKISFKIVPLSSAYAKRIRESRKDDFGHDVIEQISTGYGPCRVSLRLFEPYKDTRLLLKHSPFEKQNVYNQSGPIFIHKDEVKEYQDIHRFPPEIKCNKKYFPLTLIGYNETDEMVFTKQVKSHDVDELIPIIFINNPIVKYLHARNSEACCYICKIERS
jgi:hypothetical protein